ncbi:DUF4913 domain-containing protein [Nesterenkonia sp. E16_7]|uniref:DUF4913 domain-containing protein n=1 Tax=unclassified Nesterenkonia TaxID=2629769 RepID=UPI001A915C01|nr:DUF4913 domain-containing protein [Nesterenkonia sp. E16_10]MBO0599947.1 DUF4913 domain-containing protein [Nesterenkonia sp. E16_7]
MSDTAGFAPELEITDPDENESAAEADAPAAQPTTEAAPEPATTEDEPAEDEATALAYPNAGEWVNGWLLPHYRRQLGGSTRRWDPKWWHYEEVGGALEALWQAWEHLRLEPGTGIAVFYRDYLYPIMDQLTAPDGPFWNYHATYDPVRSNIVPPAWETTPTPRGWFREAGDPREQ